MATAYAAVGLLGQGHAECPVLHRWNWTVIKVGCPDEPQGPIKAMGRSHLRQRRRQNLAHAGTLGSGHTRPYQRARHPHVTKRHRHREHPELALVSASRQLPPR